MVGGQVLLILLVIMVAWFGVGPLQFAYAEQVRKMIANGATGATTSATATATTSTTAASATPSTK